MPKLQEKMRIIKQEEVARDIFELTLSGELVQDMKVPGQFLNLRVPSETMLLRRPISLSSWNSAAGTCILLYRAGNENSGTRALSALQMGQTVDVLGPLGKGFDLSSVNSANSDLKIRKKALIIGGGIGVPPLYQLAKELNLLDLDITVLTGFATADTIILEKEFKNLANVSLQISTDDGSYGLAGNVNDLMNTLNFRPDCVFACGPNVMLQAVAKKYDEKVDNVQLSLEARMACGIGACYACVVPKRKDETQTYKVCSDGPVFQAKELLL